MYRYCARHSRGRQQKWNFLFKRLFFSTIFRATGIFFLFIDLSRLQFLSLFPHKMRSHIYIREIKYKVLGEIWFASKCIFFFLCAGSCSLSSHISFLFKSIRVNVIYEATYLSNSLKLCGLFIFLKDSFFHACDAKRHVDDYDIFFLPSLRCNLFPYSESDATCWL